MNKISSKNYIKIRRDEYLRLKKLQERFESFLNYFMHLKDIKEARQDIKMGNIMSQEKLFKKMGL